MPASLKLKAPRVSEKQEQSDIVALLEACGYKVLLLGQKRRPVICRLCKAHNWPVYTDSTGGTPDLAVLTPGSRCALFLEVKGPGTPIRPAQQELVDGGMSRIVRNAREAARDVLAFERALGVTQNPRLVAWLGEKKE